MLLFCNISSDKMNQVIIPLNRLYDISLVDSKIVINYDAGKIIDIYDNGNFYPQVENITIRYNSNDAANKAVRQFYKVCRDGGNVFYFSNVD